MSVKSRRKLPFTMDIHVEGIVEDGVSVDMDVALKLNPPLPADFVEYILKHLWKDFRRDLKKGRLKPTQVW